MDENYINVYYADITPLNDELLFLKAYNLLSEQRKSKTDLFRLRKDKNLSLGVWLLLKKALFDIGLDINKLSFDADKNGKPFIKNSNIFFNLSHSGNYAVCAVSNKEVGCDIQNIYDIKMNIAEKYFLKSEYENIVNQKSEELKKDMFFKLWTLKESFMKLTGLGLKLPLDSFEIVYNENCINVKQNTFKGDFSFMELNISDDYKCAVCTNSDNATVKVIKSNIKEICF